MLNKILKLNVQSSLLYNDSILKSKTDSKRQRGNFK